MNSRVNQTNLTLRYLGMGSIKYEKCSCGEDKNVLSIALSPVTRCKHCDQPCEVANCKQCKALAKTGSK